MAVKTFRVLTLVLFVSLCVATLSTTVVVPTVVASSGSGGSGCGDPDTPWDKGPKAAQNPVPSSTLDSVTPNDPGFEPMPIEPQSYAVPVSKWTLVRQLLSAIVGRTIWL